MRAPAHRKRRLGSGRGERPAMGSLAQKVDTLREQLGLVDGRPLAASVDEAVFQLGLADQVKGFNLVQQADACLTALGTPSASAAAAPVAPSASAAAESVVLMGLPVGADQAPIALKTAMLSRNRQATKSYPGSTQLSQRNPKMEVDEKL